MDPPTPNDHRPIVQGIVVHSVEESLLCLLIENHLPKRMYSAIMEWGHYASSLDYDFAGALMYQTVLIRMIKKYVHVSGGPPRSEIVRVPDHAFRFLEASLPPLVQPRPNERFPLGI